MCEIEDRHTGRQRATPESCDHQRRTHLDHTAETKLLYETADEEGCNVIWKGVSDVQLREGKISLWASGIKA